MRVNNYETNIIVNNNKVKEYSKDGVTYIEGRNGTEYSLKIKNNSSNRILVVATVDGLNVIDGKVGSYNGRGYIISPYSSLVIDGWRESNEKVRKFFFTDPSKSYANRSDKGGNEGIIGFAIFKEKENELDKRFKELRDEMDRKTVPYYPTFPYSPNWWWNDNIGDNPNVTWCINSSNLTCSNGKGALYKYQASSNNPQGESVFSSFDLGTGYGEEKKSVVESVEFNREDNPNAIFEIRYATKKSLKDMGVLDAVQISSEPNAFPGEFCKPPRN